MSLDYLTEFLMKERWKVIEEFPDCEVSTEGRVRRLKSNGKYHYYTPTLRGGYPMYWTVRLRKNGRQYTRRVHRLMALAFIPNDNPDIKVTIDHLNGNPHDNRLENLQWKSQKRNNHNRDRKHNMSLLHDDGYLTDSMYDIFGEDYSLEDISTIRTQMRQGFTFENALEYLSVSKRRGVWLHARSRRVYYKGKRVTIMMLCDRFGLNYDEYKFKFERESDVTEEFNRIDPVVRRVFKIN